MNFLIRIFIKDADNTKNPLVRAAYGTLSGILGIFINIVLFASKFIAGTLASSVSMIGDAFNNLTDSASSVITLVGLKIASKPADAEHPYGHQRFEYIASMMISLIVLIIGFELIKSSIDKIINPHAPVLNTLSVIILSIAILAKLWMYLFNRKLGKKVHSTVLLATAADSISDVMATVAVLLSAIVSPLIQFQLDGYTGLLVAGFIIYTGIRILKETANHLVGVSPDKNFSKRIEDKVLSYDKIKRVHDLIIHKYGENRYFATIHAEFDHREDIMEIHDIVDNIERDVLKEMDVQLVIHMDPVALNDPRVNELYDMTKETVLTVNPSFTIHDFRIVTGPTHTNLIFDVIAPHQCKLSETEIKFQIAEKISKKDDTLFVVINVDRPFT